MKGLQERFLSSMCRSGIPATFYMVNGYQMKGTVKAFDDYTLMVDSGGGCQMVFKHAVSTITPHQRVEINTEQN